MTALRGASEAATPGRRRCAAPGCGTVFEVGPGGTADRRCYCGNGCRKRASTARRARAEAAAREPLPAEIARPFHVGNAREHEGGSDPERLRPPDVEWRPSP